MRDLTVLKARAYLWQREHAEGNTPVPTRIYLLVRDLMQTVVDLEYELRRERLYRQRAESREVW